MIPVGWVALLHASQHHATEQGNRAAQDIAQTTDHQIASFCGVSAVKRQDSAG
jgi:hypothetical protein